MINVNDFKTGMTITYEGNLYQVLEFQHVKPGKGAAIVKAKLKNLRTGSIVEQTFNAGVKVAQGHVEKIKMQYLYESSGNYTFMNMNTYEQVELKASQIEYESKFLKEGLEVLIFFYEGEMLGIELPEKVDYKIIATEPAIKGNTATNATKDATIETGLLVRVPLFIEQDEEIIVSTKDGKYVSRK
jgi:elongation factor P